MEDGLSRSETARDPSGLDAVNAALGDSFDGLIDRCRAHREALLKRRLGITDKIESRVVGEGSDLRATLSKVRDERLRIASLKKEIQELKSKYDEFKIDTTNVRSVFQNLIDKLNYNCNRMVYLTSLRSVTALSDKIRKNLTGKLDNEVVESFQTLCQLSCAMKVSPCKHLVAYVYNVTNYWYSLLGQHYSEDFEVLLKKMKWPFITTEATDNVKLNNFKQNFQHLANILMKIHFPKDDSIDLSDQTPSIQLMEHFSQKNLPITLLLVPFRKRFFFHFTGKKQTNKPDKPEWFFSRILSWIRDYREFVIDWLGPIYMENNRRPVDCQHEFILGLLQFVVIKLNSDLSHFQLEDLVFSHIVDETLAFEHELKKMYGYPDYYASVTEVLTQAHIFFKWINMERKYANIKINIILHNTNQWKVIVEDKQYFMTACADSFLTLLNTMSDRYNILRQPRHKLQFLKLQTDLLEEFKLKIMSDFNENQSNEYLIEMLCTLHYVTFILNNWGTNMQFLSLLCHKCELENEVRSRSESENTELLETAETVFDETIKSYNLGIDHLLNKECDNIMTKVKRCAKEYKRDKWHTMTSIMDENKYSITNSGWIMYETFTENLHTLNKSVPISLFNKCWPILANKFSTFILNDVLLANMFNKGGAQHLMCDIRYKLLPIFSKYTAKPSIYIERLLESCKVLCFEPNFKPVILTRDEASEILLRRIEHANLIDLG